MQVKVKPIPCINIERLIIEVYIEQLSIFFNLNIDIHKGETILIYLQSTIPYKGIHQTDFQS